MTATDERAPAKAGVRPPPAAPRTPRARAWLRAHRGMADRLGAPLLVWLLTFPTFPGAPLQGLDGSYRAGLQLAFARHLQFGSDLVYTFGPLGFLAAPEGYFGRGTLLAIAAYAGARLALV